MPDTPGCSRARPRVLSRRANRADEKNSSARRPAYELRHDPDRPDDRTCFRVRTSLRPPLRARPAWRGNRGRVLAALLLAIAWKWKPAVAGTRFDRPRKGDGGPGGPRVIPIERSEITSESRRTPAVSVVRAAATPNTRPRFVAVVGPEQHRRRVSGDGLSNPAGGRSRPRRHDR